MTSTRLPPERCTTAGLIPVMGFLLGIRCVATARIVPCARGIMSDGGRASSHRVREPSRRRALRAPGRARSGRVSSAASAASAVSWMTNTLARPVIRKIFSRRSWLHTSCERAVVGADLLQAADEHAEPGGVEELDLRHVDDEVVGAGGDQLGDLLAQAGAV